MKKALGQTVRDIKREVNKKVLKVPSTEQKVLDATSNEPWGPHGTLLADIAQASRNYHEYQMIMSVIWKRINDTGKNWRHVYKALTVLEYLVAHGSERVIDDIREHSYQIQTLSDFQYIDSSARDQGNNVRKKSQSLVVLVNDKERIQEVRQKAAANRDKYRNTSMGSMYRPGGGYEDDRYDGRYGSRDEDRNGYGREREFGNRDDDRYGRYGDSYGRDGDRYGRDYEDRYSRDGYRDDDYRGRSRSDEDYQYGSRSRSADRDRDRAYEDDGQYSSRVSGARADDNSQDGSYAGKRLERKFSEQNLGAPPSYEEAVSSARSPTYSEQGGEIPGASAPKSSSPPASASPSQAANNFAPHPAPASPPATASPPLRPSVADQKEFDSFDEFDPRGSFSAAPATSNVSASANSGGVEMDLLGSLSDSFSANSLALVPANSAPHAYETDAHVNSGSGPTFMGASSVSSVSNQTFDDPFGDGPFRAIPSTDNLPVQPQNIGSGSSYPPTTNQNHEPPQLGAQKTQTVNNNGDAYPGAAYALSGASSVQPSAANMQYPHQELSAPNQDIDILADILPMSGQPSSQAGFPPQNIQNVTQTGFPSQTSPTAQQTSFPTQSGEHVSMTSFPTQPGQPPMQTSFQVQSGQVVPQTNFYAQTTQPTSLTGYPAPGGQVPQTGFPSQMGSPLQAAFPAPSTQQNSNFYGAYNPQMGPTGQVNPLMAPQVSMGPTSQHSSMNFLSLPAAPVSSQMAFQSPPVQSGAPVVSQSTFPASTGSLVTASQPAKDKFETKSTVWTDTLNRGLVNLNISGSKINPLADIGVDFDAINRKEKRMEKPTTTQLTSTVTMGKAMGSGSGIGRAGASAIRGPPNPMMGSGMGMGMGMGMGGGPGPGMGMGMGMGGYGGVNQPMAVGMGMNIPPNMGMGMGMGMNMAMGQGGQMQRPVGFPPGSSVPGGYNPMMGTGNYGQQPYGGGYR